MNYTALLCHFCEREGPTVLLTTYIDSSIRPEKSDEKTVLENLNRLSEVEVAMASVKSSCEYCHSLTEQAPFIVSWPAEATVAGQTSNLTFLSSRLPPGNANKELIKT
jgi:hypothetical protein